MNPRRIIVGISGATGAIFGITLLRMLRSLEVETHLVVSKFGRQCIEWETPHTLEEIGAMASVVHNNGNLAASISSGSFRTDGMVIAPCSITTLSGIANSYSDKLMVRAADVCLKERRPLVLMVRETPLHLGHLRLMVRVAEMGGIILPPVPAFYQRPANLNEMVENTASRTLDALGIDHGFGPRWGEGGLTAAGLAAKPVLARENSSPSQSA